MKVESLLKTMSVVSERQKTSMFLTLLLERTKPKQVKTPTCISACRGRIINVKLLLTLRVRLSLHPQSCKEIENGTAGLVDDADEFGADL
jgi:hypothetical protein